MQSGLSALLHLRATLDAIGDAARDGRTDTLLDCESQLVDALRRLRTSAPDAEAGEAGVDGSAWRAGLAATRAALRRCERLGGGLRDTVRAVLVAQGRAGAYDRGAQEAFERARGAVDARG